MRGDTAIPTTILMIGHGMSEGPLLASNVLSSPSAIKFNFIRMSCLFALNHGAVTSVLTLCVVVLGSSIGSYMNGALYVTYATTALCGSSAIVGALGYRRALIVGTAVYCVYAAPSSRPTVASRMADARRSSAPQVRGRLSTRAPRPGRVHPVRDRHRRRRHRRRRGWVSLDGAGCLLLDVSEAVPRGIGGGRSVADGVVRGAFWRHLPRL